MVPQYGTSLAHGVNGASLHGRMNDALLLFARDRAVSSAAREMCDTQVHPAAELARLWWREGGQIESHRVANRRDAIGDEFIQVWKRRLHPATHGGLHQQPGPLVRDASLILRAILLLEILQMHNSCQQRGEQHTSAVEGSKIRGCKVV